MCRYEKCTGPYGEAYAGSESVLLEASMLCPKCAHWVEVSGHVHFGGQQWQPSIQCPNCEWSIFLTIVPKGAFLSRKDPLPAIEPRDPEPPKETSATKTIDEATAEHNERRIWWQEEVDRRVAALAGWEPMLYWRGVYIGELPLERKRATAAGIEHAIEEAKSA